MQPLFLCSHRQRHSTTDRKLLAQRCRQYGCGSGHDDAVKRRSPGQPDTAISMTRADIAQFHVAQLPSGAFIKRLDALHGIDLFRYLRQHRRLVAAAGADFQHAAKRLAGAQHFDHARHDVGPGNGLVEIDRQRHVIVSGASQRPLGQTGGRAFEHRRQHRLVLDTLLAQPLDHARTGALRSHANAAKPRIHCPSQPRTASSWLYWVRSIFSGVSETRCCASAWKSVPSPASCALPAAPTQYTVSPCGLLAFTTGSALCRLPRRVTSMPCNSSWGTSGTFTLSSHGWLCVCPAKRCTNSAAILAAVS